MNLVFLILAVAAGCTFLAGIIPGLVAWHSTDPQVQKKLRPFIIVCIFLTIAFTGASYYSIKGISPSPLPSPTSISDGSNSPSSIPTTVSSRTVLYNADWSKGSGGWMDGTAIGEWSISSGMLNNSGSAVSNPVLLAPQIQSSSTNYTVSADIQYNNTSGNYAFGIIVGSDGGSDGYACYLTGSNNQSINMAIVSNSYNSQILDSLTTLASLNELVEDTSVHTYHVKVSGAQIIFWIDTGKQIVFQMPTNNNLSLQKTYVGLIDNYGVISVSNFKVSAS